VLAPGLKDGEILKPFKTEFGWHVVQVMYHQPDSAAMESLRNRIVSGSDDFEQAARDYSEGPEAGEGGDKGWTAKGLIDERLLRTIFETPVGEVSQIVEIPDGGLFLYKVLEERTQKPDEEQADTIEARAFQNWYGEKKSGVTITRELLDALQAAG
jgi:parvulin-like peptidyl-prolyl isomerase